MYTPIARDNSIRTAGSGNLSTSFTISGSNRILFVITSSDGANPATAVTYNGVSLTQIGTNISPAKISNLWYLLNPATGANTLAATGYANAGSGLVASSYTGVIQSSPINVTNQTSGSGTSWTISATTTIDNCWGIMLGSSGGITSLTAGTNASLIQSPIDGNSTTALFDTNSNQTPIGSKSMTFNGDSASKGAIVAFFAPAQQPAVIYTLDGLPASFVITGLSLGAMFNKVLNCLPASFIVTGKSIMFDRWTRLVKKVSTWIDQNKS